MSTSTPDNLIWGVSYAMHLVPGINATRGNHSIIQATKYLCGPLVGVSPIGHAVGTTQNVPWAKACLDFNASVLEYARTTPSVKTVVLSSVLKQYMTPEELHVVVRANGAETQQDGGIDVALKGLENTVRSLRAIGKKVVVIAPPPAMDWDAGLCAERKLRGLPTFGPSAECSIPDGEYREKRKNVLTFLDRLQTQLDVNVIRFDDTLSEGDSYSTMQGDTIDYIANGHLSDHGSVSLARKMGVWKLIETKAK